MRYDISFYAIGLMVLGGVLRVSAGSERGTTSGGNERKGRKEKGLPDDQTIREMVELYVAFQLKAWPVLAQKGLIPPKTAASVDHMAAEFSDRFRDNNWTPILPEGLRCTKTEIAEVYLRYSCDNSNPRSLPQQLRNCLKAAQAEGLFIPWELVFADAAVTGTNANRRGYEMAKATISTKSSVASVLIIDELGRASRDMIESLKLGRMVGDAGRRLLGATDGFDSMKPQSKMMLTVFAMLHELFVDQLSAKVQRGMHDAFECGKNIRPAAFGYKLSPVLDENGDLKLRTNGKPESYKEIHQENALWVRAIFDMFVNQKKSPNAIARHFNQQCVDGKKSWEPTTITCVLERATYVGLEYDGKSTSRRDPKTGKSVVEQLPKSEWRKREVPHLRIIPDDLWEAAQLRLLQNSQAFAARGGARGGRATRYPKTLLRPYCGYCNRDLSLGHSGKHPSFCCATGVRKKHECKLTGYKSVNIVESAILRHLRETLVSEENLTQLVRLANQAITKAASEPAPDAGPLRKALEQLNGSAKRLLTAIELNHDEPVEELNVKYRQCQDEIAELKSKIRHIEGSKSVRPKRISKNEVVVLLKDLRSLLSDDVRNAATVLADALGPIKVTVLPGPPNEKAVWQAEFSGNLIPLIAHVASEKEYPSAQSWEYLTLRRWTHAIDAVVRLETVPQYVQMAPTIKEMADKGASINSIAGATGLCWRAVKDILQYLETGKLPDSKTRPTSASRARGSDRPSNPPYAKHSVRVAELRAEKLSFEQIVRQIEAETGVTISTATARRAFDHVNRDQIAEDLKQGRRPNRGRSRLLSSQAVARIHELLQTTANDDAIANEVGCGKSTVRRERALLRHQHFDRTGP